MTSRIVRNSKFRHVFGTAARKEHCYDGLRITKSNWEGSTYCAVNPKFVAIIIECAGGGAFVVQPIGKPGRIERDVPVVGGHKGEVLDLKWCPHHDQVIASASEDCTVKIWEIPESGLSTTMTDPIVDLVYHQRRVGLIEWHPTASNILVSSGADNEVCLWDVGAGDILAHISMKDIVFSINFNYNGSKLVTACKDKKIRVHDARTLEVSAEEKAHAGAKAAQAVFLKDDRIFTTGFSKMSDRQYALFDKSGPNSIGGSDGPLVLEDIDTSNGVLFIFYDPDTSVIYLAGKGDSVIRYFEVGDEAPYVHWLNNYTSTTPQRGVGYMPKRGVNVNTCEIARLASGSGNQGGYCEPIAFTVPRKSELYQDDLYPDAKSEEASLTADEWFTEKKDADPLLISMRDNFQTTGAQKAKVRSSVLTAGKKPAAAKTPASSNGAGDKSAVKAAAAPSPAAAPASAPAPAASSSADVTALIEEIKALKATVEENKARISSLEEKVAGYESADAV